LKSGKYLYINSCFSIISSSDDFLNSHEYKEKAAYIKHYNLKDDRSNHKRSKSSRNKGIIASKTEDSTPLNSPVIVRPIMQKDMANKPVNAA
jgi:hypothetical protein